MNYSSLAKRFGAFIVDSMITAFIGGGLALATGLWYTSFISVFVSAAYYIFCEGSVWHATLGKKLFNIIVVDENGKGIDYGKAAVRYIGRYLSGLILGIGYLVAAFSDEKQTLHDKLANTYVVDGSFNDAGVGTGSESGHAVIGIRGEVAGTSFPIKGNGLLMGYDPTVCQIVLKRSKGVSRMHCFVSYNPASGMFILSDRGSSYGTFTQSGLRVTPERNVALKSGERFYLGCAENLFEVK